MKKQPKKEKTVPKATVRNSGIRKTVNRPRLHMTMVVKAISQLGNERGSTQKSILNKLQRRTGGENFTRQQVERALDRLLQAGKVREVTQERFSLPSLTERSRSLPQARNPSCSAASKFRRQVSLRIKDVHNARARGVQNRNGKAGGNANKKRAAQKRSISTRRTSRKINGGEKRGEGSLMDLDSVTGESQSGDEKESSGSDNNDDKVESSRLVMTEHVFGPDARMHPPFQM